MTDNWRIVCLMQEYNERYQATSSFDAREYLDYIYSTAIRLQIKKDNHGDIFTIADFCDAITSGCITDYDGCGRFISDDGDTLSEEHIRCNTSWIIKNKGEYNFIIWYNK